jgi:hypothetical protein
VASAAFVGVALSNSAHAQIIEPGDQLMLAYGPRVLHRDSSPEHVPWNHFVALELQTRRTAILEARRASFGLAVFNNSFGQLSQYAYWGLQWDLGTAGPGTVYGKATVGILHGYKGEYEDKVPLNANGYSPAIVPTIGYRVGKLSAELALLGGNGVLAVIGFTFDPF